MRQAFSGLVAVFATGFLASSLQAYPVSGLGHGEGAHPQSAPLNCTDFSGAWQGQCRINSKSAFTDDIRVRQVGCAIFVKGEEVWPIDGIANESYSLPTSADLPGSSTTIVRSASWDATRTFINTRLTIFTASTGAAAKVTQSSGQGKVWLEDGKLREVFQTEGQDNAQLDCTYNKK